MGVVSLHDQTPLLLLYHAFAIFLRRDIGNRGKERLELVTKRRRRLSKKRYPLNVSPSPAIKSRAEVISEHDLLRNMAAPGRQTSEMLHDTDRRFSRDGGDISGVEGFRRMLMVIILLKTVTASFTLIC